MNNAQKKTIKVGLIGSGFMGKCHANAFRNVTSMFDLPCNVELTCLADIDLETATRAANAMGFTKATDDWMEIMTDPEIDIVSITSPNVLHERMAIEAAKHKKAIYCEKPLSTTSEAALRMVDAAKQAGVVTQVGFNFLRNPLFARAKAIIDAGELGEIISFRGRHAENYMSDPNQAHSFRTSPEGGGALADIGSHITSLARFLLGPMTRVNAVQQTVIKQRPVRHGSEEMSPVTIDDVSHVLVEFERGTIGSIDVCWMQTGRSMDLSFEITGTKGALRFSQERMNELLFFKPDQAAADAGFTKIETGVEHKPYGNFCPASGHHIGFNDLKIIEAAELILALTEGTPIFTDFSEGYQVQKTIDAMQMSSASKQWVSIND